jgi:predicted deacylase
LPEFLDVPVQRGAVNYERVAVGEFSDGSPVAVPVVTIGGCQDGPVLYIQAGLHGDEVTGIEICQRALAAIDPAQLRGTVVAVPVANVPAYLSRTRGWLHEERWMIDMNRVWPGNAAGLLSERICDILFEQFVKHADLTLDLHSALEGCDIAPFVYIDPDDDDQGTLQRRETCGRAFGTPYVYYKASGAKLGTSDMSRSLGSVAEAHGLAKVTAEMGESRRVSNEVVSLGVDGILNVAGALGMLDRSLPDTSTQREFHQIKLVHVTRGGLLRMAVNLHDEVVAGQPIGEVVDVFGRTVETIESPIDGWVLRVMRLANVATGAEVAWVVR